MRKSFRRANTWQGSVLLWQIYSICHGHTTSSRFAKRVTYSGPEGTSADGGKTSLLALHGRRLYKTWSKEKGAATPIAGFFLEHPEAEAEAAGARKVVAV